MKRIIILINLILATYTFTGEKFDLVNSYPSKSKAWKPAVDFYLGVMAEDYKKIVKKHASEDYIKQLYAKEESKLTDLFLLINDDAEQLDKSFPIEVIKETKKEACIKFRRAKTHILVFLVKVNKKWLVINCKKENS